MSSPRFLPVVAVGLVLALAGCGTPPWREAGATASPSVAASASPTPTPTAKPSATQRNDLSKGSVHKTLHAGGIDLTMAYYSTLDLAQWTPSADKPLTVSLTAAFQGGYEQDIYLTKVTVRMDPIGTDASSTDLEPLTDTATVAPGYLVKDPNSYNQVFTLPAMPESTRGVTLNFTFELLAQSAPKSKMYTRQTAGDTVVIALASA